MAKEKERKAARILYVEQGRTAKEVAELVGVAEKTVGTWVQKFGWKADRNNEALAADKRIENIREIIDFMATERLRFQKQIAEQLKESEPDTALIAELRKQIASIDDGASKWNKALINVQKDERPTVRQYLFVMKRIFESLQQHDIELFYQTLAFQEQHVAEVSKLYA